jgi:hypothetical protein
MELQGKFKGILKVDPIKYKAIIQKTVSRQNKSSGKINLPADLIDKEVLVLVLSETE